MFRMLTQGKGELALLAFGLTVSVFLFITAIELDRKADAAQFDELATQRIAAVRANIVIAEDTVRMLASHFSVTPPHETSRSSFNHLTELSIERHPFIQALEWIPKTPDKDRTRLERQAKTDGYPQFSFTERSPDGRMIPAGMRAEYYPVYYVFPYDSNRPALGFDLGSDPTRLAALNAARDTGTVTSTARITLVQETGDQYGVLMFAPAFPMNTPNTIAAHRKSLMGYALGVFRIGDLFGMSPDKGGADIELHLYDLSANADSSQLFPKTPALDMSTLTQGLYRSAELDVGGRQWRIIATPGPQLVPPIVPANAVAVLLAALMTLSALLLYVKRGRERAINDALTVSNQELQTRTKELELANSAP